MKNAVLAICAFAALGFTQPVYAASQSEAARPVSASPINGAEQNISARTTTALSYAEREKASPQTADFKGGDAAGIYIGGSTLAIVLLIVLLVILL